MPPTLAPSAPHRADIVRFLGFIVSGASDATLDAEWGRLEPKPAADELLATATRFSVTAALGRVASRLHLPLDGVRSIVAAALLRRAHSDRSLAMLRQLLKDPAVASSEPIVVKGAALRLSDRHGEDREFVDVDIVVRDGSLAGWEQAASRAGAAFKTGRAAAYEIGYITGRGGLLEIHGALAGGGGSESGPSYEELRRHALPLRDLPALVPDAAASREITVHHFVFHHGGEAAHGLRTLQDLAVLDDGTEGPALEWHEPRLCGAIELLTATMRAAREGRVINDFFDRIAIAAGDELDQTAEFSREVELWLNARKSSGRSRLALVVRRMFPPVHEMREQPDDSRIKLATRYITRLSHLAGSYVRGSIRRATNPRERRLKSWRRFLQGR